MRSSEGWNDHIYANNAGTMMDRNLGATSATPGDVGAFGLLYQWGRKDPFMGSCAKSGTTLAASTGEWNTVSGGKTIDWAEDNPTTYITGYEWCSGQGSGKDTGEFRWKDETKTLYDPCPVGYRVPKGGNDGFWATANVKSTGDSTNCGMYWTLADGKTTAWYPTCDFRNYNSGALNGGGREGYCWSGSPNPSDQSIARYAYSLYFYYNGDVSSAFSYRVRGDGCSVRCVKE